MRPLRWGILGSGWIAERFIGSARPHARQEIAAVGSRRQEKAGAFAQACGIERGHDSHEALGGGDTLDLICVAMPHSLHLRHVRLALEAGCNVLVKKPMGVDRRRTGALAASRSAY